MRVAQVRHDGLQLALVDLAVGAVDRDPLTFLHHRVVDADLPRLEVDVSSLTPTTAGLPNWRATSAAWLVRPPRAVKTPLAASMPCTSSGLVSRRTMITARPSWRDQRWAVSASSATTPPPPPGTR